MQLGVIIFIEILVILFSPFNLRFTRHFHYLLILKQFIHSIL